MATVTATTAMVVTNGHMVIVMCSGYADFISIPSDKTPEHQGKRDQNDPYIIAAHEAEDLE